MTDCGHSHTHKAQTGRLLAALAVISVFLVVEVIGGIISGSLALLADAVHMLTDAFALALAASANWLSARPADQRLHFGYRRTQVLAAFVNGVVLMVLLCWIIFEAIQRFVTPVEVSWQPMLGVAVIGLAANGVAFWILHAVIAALVIAATGFMRIDPILSVFVAFLVARAAIRLLKDTGHILLEGAPQDIDVDKVIEELSNVSPTVTDVHNVQIWQLTPEHPRMTLHVHLSSGDGAQETLRLLKERIAEKFGVSDTTIQLEFNDGCPDISHEHHERHHVHAHNEKATLEKTPPIAAAAAK